MSTFCNRCGRILPDTDLEQTSKGVIHKNCDPKHYISGSLVDGEPWTTPPANPPSSPPFIDSDKKERKQGKQSFREKKF